jgi:hypothetical protein
MGFWIVIAGFAGLVMGVIVKKNVATGCSFIFSWLLPAMVMLGLGSYLTGFFLSGPTSPWTYVGFTEAALLIALWLPVSRYKKKNWQDAGRYKFHNDD